MNKLYPYLTKGLYVLKGLKPEDKLAYDLRTWLTQETLEGRLGCVWFHVANEVSNNVQYQFGKKLSSLGKLPGVADYIFLWGTGCAALELKAGKNSLSPAQHIFKEWCEQHGVCYYIGRDLEDIKEWVYALFKIL